MNSMSILKLYFKVLFYSLKYVCWFEALDKLYTALRMGRELILKKCRKERVENGRNQDN
jgi:hypothetical protein